MTRTILAVLALVVGAATLQESAIGRDAAGNVHVNTSDPDTQRVFVNGVDVVARVAALASTLAGTQARIAAQSSAAAEIRAQADTLIAASPLGKLYAVGSFADGTAVHRFDGTAWAPAPSLNTARPGTATAFYRGYIFAMGGSASFGASQINSVERFDGLAWSFAPSLLMSLTYGCAAVLGDRIYLAGGLGGGGPMRTVVSFDGVVWSLAPSMALARHSHGCVSTGGMIYVAGGWSGSAALSSMERFNGTFWRTMPQMLQERARFCFILFGRATIVASGGATDATTDTYNIITNEWSPLSTGTPIVPLRNSASCAILPSNSTLYIFGGEADGAADTAEVFNGTHWRLAANLPAAWNLRSAVVFS